MTDVNAPVAPAYAGFGKRLYAYLIDQSLIQGVTLLLLAPYGAKQAGKIWEAMMGMLQSGLEMPMSMADLPSSYEGMPPALVESVAALAVLLMLFVSLMFVVGVIYGALMEASERGATFGKRYCGLRVVTEEGAQIGFWAALLRNIGINFLGAVLVLSVEIFFFLLPVYLMSFFVKKRQTLYDLGLKTIVVSGRQALPF